MHLINLKTKFSKYTYIFNDNFEINYIILQITLNW